jgi:membrane associated rhomboid family serine protease
MPRSCAATRSTLLVPVAARATSFRDAVQQFAIQRQLIDQSDVDAVHLLRHFRPVQIEQQQLVDHGSQAPGVQIAVRNGVIVEKRGSHDAVEYATDMKITAVKILIAINVAVFGLQELDPNGRLEELFALWPLQPLDGTVYFRFWQIVSYSFLHSTQNYMHLLFNMWSLWMFGEAVEQAMGPRRFLVLYFAAVVTAALSQLVVPILFGAPPAPTIGASGGVFGVMLAFGMLYPRAKILLFFALPMPAYVFVPLAALLELVLGVTGSQSGVAHFAHLGGLIGGGLVVLQWRRRLSPKNSRL